MKWRHFGTFLVCPDHLCLTFKLCLASALTLLGVMLAAVIFLLFFVCFYSQQNLEPCDRGISFSRLKNRLLEGKDHAASKWEGQYYEDRSKGNIKN